MNELLPPWQEAVARRASKVATLIIDREEKDSGASSRLLLLSRYGPGGAEVRRM